MVFWLVFLFLPDLGLVLIRCFLCSACWVLDGLCVGSIWVLDGCLS